MAKTRSQDEDTKGKGVDAEDPMEQRMAQLEESQVKANQKLDALMAMLSRLPGIQESDDHSTLERDTSPLSKTQGDGSGSFTKIRDDRKPEGEGQGRTDSHRSYNHLTRMGKIEFPKFDGKDMKGWLFKAEEFFGLDYTPPEMKVRMASIHFEGFAAKWHQNFIKSDVGMSVRFDWKRYVHFMKDMFEEDDDDPMAELKNLREKEGIRDYHQKFETVRTRLKLPEDYLVSVYLAGLRTDTRMHVKMFRPETVRDCYYLGKTYEKASPKQAVTSGWSSKSSNSEGFSRNQKEMVTEQTKDNTKPSFQPTKKLSPQEMSDRRSKGLCYLCDEKFTPEHYATAHKKIQLFCMGVEDEFEDAEEELCEEEEPILDNVKPMPRISVNAVSGISDYCTMRVKGTYDKNPLFVLIDSGSTHNFVDTGLAAKLGCKVDKAGLTQVCVADGRKLKVDGKIKEFEWNFQHTTFQSDVLLIPLKGNDMVLGVQWLETLGNIDWEFKKLEMSFKYRGKKVLLSGIKTGSVKDIKAHKLQKLQESQIQLAMLWVQEVTTEEENGEMCTVSTLTVEEKGNSIVEKLVKNLPDIFMEPKEPPPFKNHHDHRIELLVGSEPVNQRPFRLGRAAYKLQLSSTSQLLPDFNVSQLQGIKTGSVREVKAQKLLKLPENQVQLAMLCVQDVNGQEELGGIGTLNALQVEGSGGSDKLLTDPADVFTKEPDLILERKMAKCQSKAVTMVLVKWRNESVEEATWESLCDLQKKKKFPELSLNLEDKVVWRGKM